MEYRNLGRTGLRVSRFCLGTMTFGSQVPEADAAANIRRALDAGVNFVDTADQYSGGRSEEITGRALKGVRQSVVLATKAANRSGPGPNDAGLSRLHILNAIENSLRRLGTDYVDIYYVHFPDYDTPIDETLRALDDLVRSGKVRYIACSNFAAWQLCKALWVSDRLALECFVCIQPPYNLITRDIETELLPLCASEGIGVCVYNPLAAGLLTGKHNAAAPPAAATRFSLENLGLTYRSRYWSDVNFQMVTRLGQVAREHGHSLVQYALGWVLANRTITAAIIGATSMAQLEENLKAAETKLTPEETAAADGIWQLLRPPRFFYGR